MQRLLTQTEIEEVMYRGGINRAERNMTAAEENGRAYQNPYASEVFSTYVLPLARVIEQDLSYTGAGTRQAHINLLKGLDPEAIAFLAVRTMLSSCLTGTDHRALMNSIGAAVHRELVLEQIAQALPDLYFTLVTDLGRKMSKSERHKVTVMRLQAQKAGYEVREWNIGSRDQVGSYLIELADTAGLLTLGPVYQKGLKQPYRTVNLHPDVLERIDAIKDFVSVSMPVYGPCVEPPLDWGFQKVGGFHTPVMQRTNRSLVHGRPYSKEIARDTDMPVVYAAANALQRTAWRVNTRVLDTVTEISKNFNTEEIVALEPTPAPDKPEWLNESWAREIPKDEWPEHRMRDFLRWKHATAEWHTQTKLAGVRYGRFYSATRAATMFRDYPAIYFVYFADSRGRLYPLTYGLNSQGSDLSKALLHFAEGKPVANKDAEKWFHVQGANKWGFDKGTLEERVAWVKERKELVLSFAEHPLDNRGWLEADKPLQFLAWCFEYRDYVLSPNTFLSYLPISMDGSCNGLQNLSALFRDEIGGAATNLTNNKVMQDIYARVAEAAQKRLAARIPEDEAGARIRALWLAHGKDRKAVKRAVMTTPYGVTERTATTYVLEDYLRKGIGPSFEKTEQRQAAQMLMSCVWPAIGDVVVKGREALTWLQKSARTIVKNFSPDEEPVIWWRSPSGFPASQAYFKPNEHRIRTRLHGPVKIKVHSEGDEPDAGRHASGLAPNFVHSLDAAHLHLTCADAAAAGITSLAMIHDDYGTHAADSQKLYDVIRKQFVAMYLACDPAQELKDKYPCISDPPTKGTLDILEVLESEFFFS